MRVEYGSNNSGGNWWLNDRQWRDLEDAGWEVEWFAKKPNGICRPDKDGRWLGALASRATRHGLHLREAVEEWERITGANSTAAGCACCGPPHSFIEYDDDDKYVASGPETRYEAHWD